MGNSIPVGKNCGHCFKGQDGTHVRESSSECATDSSRATYIWDCPKDIREGSPMALIANFASIGDLPTKELWEIIARLLPNPILLN